MSEMKNKVNLSAYKKEMKDVLERLVKTMPAYKELRFFVKCVINHYLTDFEKNNSDIVVIGSNIPEELVLVSGKMPYWILGGSRVSSMWADDIVPRDTDPVSRSGLGSIVSGFAENALILIPLVNDSTRKLAYILKSKGLKVHTFHFPPVKGAQTVLEWRRQYEACREAVAKSIGTLCVMVPAELVYAAGAMPVRLCSGSYTAYSIGDDYIPRDACPLVKAVMGFGKIKALPAFDNCSLLVAPVTCDCKKKLAGTIDSVKDTIPLHIPPLKKDDADTEIFLKELYRLIPLLENVTGKQVTAKSLAEGINMVGNAQYEMSEFLKYRRHDLSLMSGTQVMAVMNAYSYMPVNLWAEQMHRLNEELKLRLSQGRFVSRKNQPRILVTGSPIAFPNIKVPLLIEEMGGVLAADETCMGERGLYDPVSVIDASFDGMMRSLASRYTKPCTCPVFVDNSQRIYRIKQMIKEHKIHLPCAAWLPGV